MSVYFHGLTRASIRARVRCVSMLVSPYPYYPGALPTPSTSRSLSFSSPCVCVHVSAYTLRVSECPVHRRHRRRRAGRVNDLLRYEPGPGAWAQLSPAGRPPPPRFGFAFAAAAAGGGGGGEEALFVFGGSGEDGDVSQFAPCRDRSGRLGTWPRIPVRCAVACACGRPLCRFGTHAYTPWLTPCYMPLGSECAYMLYISPEHTHFV